MHREQLVSVIITTRNEEEVIERLIQSVSRQAFKNIEIILVDNNSTDKTIEIAEKFNVKIFNIGPERSAQRNYGAKKSKGGYLLFLDADMELTKNVIKQCVECIESDSNLGAISIPEESIGNTYWEKIKAFERSFYNLEGDSTTDAARFFTRKAFNAGRGYDEMITGPEDWDLTDRIRKMGYKVDLIPELIFHYERISSPIDLARKKFYYGLKSHRYLSKHSVPLISSKTIYFLRPVFYRRFDRLLKHPILSMGLFIMLSLEIIAGGFGYFYGRVKKF